MIFRGADTSGFEADARLTAMWLWTLNAVRVRPTNGTRVSRRSNGGRTSDAITPARDHRRSSSYSSQATRSMLGHCS